MKMRNRKSARSLAKQKSDFMRFTDGVSNPLLRIGTGTLNSFAASTYRPEFVSMGRQVLEWAYQTSWLCGLAVDVVAEDMTREGIELKLDDPQIADRINADLDDYGVMESLCETIKWARLDGQSVDEPLESVPPGSFRGLLVLDRWQLDNTNFDPVQEMGPDFGKPDYYRVVAKNCEVDFGTDRIHHSRVIRLEGRKLPFYLLSGMGCKRSRADLGSRQGLRHCHLGRDSAPFQGVPAVLQGQGASRHPDEPDRCQGLQGSDGHDPRVPRC